MKKLFIAIVATVISTFATAQDGLNVGEKAPDFKGKDQNGKSISLKEALKKGKVVVVFYRGYWCPNCTRELSNIQDSISLLTAQKVTVIGIGPETKEGIAKIVKNSKASFSVIGDDGLKIMTAYKVAFAVTPDMDEIHTKYNIDVAGNNGKNGNMLPKPSAFIIGQNGLITYRYINTDPYSNPNSAGRISVKELLEKSK